MPALNAQSAILDICREFSESRPNRKVVLSTPRLSFWTVLFRHNRPGFELTPCHPHQRVSPPPPIPHARAHARHHRRRRCCCCCCPQIPSHRIGIGKKRDGYRTSVLTKIGSVSNLCMNPDPLSPRSPFPPTSGQRLPTLARGLF